MAAMSCLRVEEALHSKNIERNDYDQFMSEVVGALQSKSSDE